MSRKVRVATVSFLYRGGPTVEDNRERMRGLIEQAVAEKPDIVALPETFVTQGVDYGSLDEVAEPVSGAALGPTVDMVSGYARKHDCYIICPPIGIHGDKYMNDAVLLDRRGEVAGVYAKVHPVVEGSAFDSLERGVTPGSEVPVFETDFGRIGIQICFDIMYPEPWAELKGKGAEIVFWCSAYDGGKHLGIYAWQHRYYVVSAVQSRYARVIDIMGDTLAKSGWHDPVLAHTIDLDVGLFHCDFNGSVIADIRKVYGPDVTVRTWHEEGLFTLETNREDLSVADVVEEFRLDPLDDYLARNTKLQDAVREGRDVPDLTPDYVGRVQWS
ncbi:MAG: carbon-nitrogen hydrolase family protein [Anaerolineae bacterium]